MVYNSSYAQDIAGISGHYHADAGFDLRHVCLPRAGSQGGNGRKTLSRVRQEHPEKGSKRRADAGAGLYGRRFVFRRRYDRPSAGPAD